MEALVDDAVAPLRMTAWLISCFGLFAVVLAALGIYGVVAYAASRRTCEIGVRIALGARPADVLRLMMRRGGRLVITGLALGLTLSVGMTMLLSGAAAEEGAEAPAADGWWLVGLTILLLALVALAAGWVPARRATRTDPVVALRHN